MSRRFLAVTAVLVAGAVWTSPSASAAGSRVPAPVPVGPFARYVDVSVATSWVAAGGNRPGIDDRAVSAPADPRSWVASMTQGQSLALTSLLETQALYGTRVTVDEQVTVNGLL